MIDVAYTQILGAFQRALDPFLLGLGFRRVHKSGLRYTRSLGEIEHGIEIFKSSDNPLAWEFALLAGVYAKSLGNLVRTYMPKYASSFGESPIGVWLHWEHYEETRGLRKRWCVTEEEEVAFEANDIRRTLVNAVVPAFERVRDFEGLISLLDPRSRSSKSGVSTYTYFYLLCIAAAEDVPRLRETLPTIRERMALSNAGRDFESYQDFEARLFKDFDKLRAVGESVPQVRPLPERLDAPAIPESVETQDLSGRRLKALPDWVGSLSRVRHLYLRDNQLLRLPESLRGLSHLHTVDLSRNTSLDLANVFTVLEGLPNLLTLDDCEIASLPEELGRLKRLSKLSLKDNRLVSLPEFIGELESLTALNVGGNPLKTLPAGMGRLKNLTRLNLMGTFMKEVPQEVLGLGKLTYLELDGTSKKVIHQFRTALPRAKIVF
jgi:hypothetical protein